MQGEPQTRSHTHIYIYIYILGECKRSYELSVTAYIYIVCVVMTYIYVAKCVHLRSSISVTMYIKCFTGTGLTLFTMHC